MPVYPVRGRAEMSEVVAPLNAGTAACRKNLRYSGHPLRSSNPHGHSSIIGPLVSPSVEEMSTSHNVISAIGIVSHADVSARYRRPAPVVSISRGRWPVSGVSNAATSAFIQMASVKIRGGDVVSMWRYELTEIFSLIARDPVPILCAAFTQWA